MPILTLTNEITIPIEHKTFLYCMAHYGNILSLLTKHEVIRININTKSIIEVLSEHNFLHEVWLPNIADLEQANDMDMLTQNQYKRWYSDWHGWNNLSCFLNEKKPILAHHKYKWLKLRYFAINGDSKMIMLKRRKNTTKSVLHVYADKYNLLESITNSHTNNLINVEIIRLPNKKLMLMTIGFLDIHKIKTIYKPLCHYAYIKRNNHETMDTLKIGFWDINVNYWYPLKLICQIDETAKREIQSKSKDKLNKVGIVMCAGLMQTHNVWFVVSVDDILCDVLSWFIN